MRVADFKQLKVVEVDGGANIKFRLKLDKLLDEPYTVFMDAIQLVFSEIKKIEKLPKVATFQIFTDLNDDDLEMVRNNIFNTICNTLVIEKVDKHEEHRMGLPKTLLDVDILLLTMMDLVNYPLLIESFNIKIYNKDGALYNEMIGKEEK